MTHLQMSCGLRGGSRDLAELSPAFREGIGQFLLNCLDAQSMQTNCPKPLKLVQNIVILHRFGVQVPRYPTRLSCGFLVILVFENSDLTALLEALETSPDPSPNLELRAI